jgi:hypothetical protein
MRVFLGFLGMCVALGALAAEGRLAGLSAEKFAAAGLHKLTPAELAQLETIVAELAAAPKSAPASPVAPAATPAWLRALVTLQEVGREPEGAEVFESRLAGDYTGWEGRTLFRLENGQVWQQADAGVRVDDRRVQPRVRLRPGAVGTYWLEIEGVRERVKVRPVKLQ